MKWIDVNERLPEEKLYVLIWVDGYIGISRYIEGEWECGSFKKRPMYKNKERIQSKLEASFWMALPAPPEEL